MASVIAAGNSRLLANPWLWTGAGLVLQGAALAWRMASGGSSEHPLQLSLVWLALVLAGAGVVIQFQAHEPTPRAPAALTRLALAALTALMTLTLIVFCVAAWSSAAWVGMKPAAATVIMLLAAPLAGLASWQCLVRVRADEPLSRLEEAAALVAVLALTLRLGSLALPDALPNPWYTMELLLRVLAWVALVAVPLCAAEQTTRRWAASAMILFHFFGIITATLSISPSPWVFGQIWVRVYRPYLEFLYLNNAYHFYSPEPGPACYVWFRLYFDDGKQGKPQAWVKVPRLDERGRHGHKVALLYQRVLSLTENTVPGDTVSIDSQAYQECLERRVAFSPEAAKKVAILGKAQAQREEDMIPFHPQLTRIQQFKPPNADTRRLIKSYVRHVADEAMRDNPGLTLEKVRVYRVVHVIPPAFSYLDGWDPNHPAYYHPYYFGEYDIRGQLLDAKDPFLYWMLPVLPSNNAKMQSAVLDWARRHAGDPAWVCRFHPQTGKQHWGEEREP